MRLNCCSFNSRRHMWTSTTTNLSTFLLCSLLLLAYLMECAQADYQVITNEFLSGFDSESKEASKTAPLRVVTFNIWLSGAGVSNGLVKIAKQIAQLNPDIVALQILQDQLVQVSCGNGVPIVVDAQGSSFTVNFFSMHLNYSSYGPYAAQNKMVTKAEQIYKGEKTADGKGRVSNMQELLDNPKFQAFLQDAEKKGHPLFVAGDFNCPSHQDWTEQTKHLHGDWVFEWPVTKLLTGIGMVDSFRQLHPNVLEVPGYTWSTVQKWSGSEWDYSIPEPQDRLDFIFYKGSQGNIKPVKSFTYSGNAGDPLKAIPNQYENNYPSDHFIVLTDFEVLVEKQD